MPRYRPLTRRSRNQIGPCVGACQSVGDRVPLPYGRGSVRREPHLETVNIGQKRMLRKIFCQKQQESDDVGADSCARRRCWQLKPQASVSDRRSHKKKGPPHNAVTTPTGISAGAMVTREINDCRRPGMPRRRGTRTAEAPYDPRPISSAKRGARSNLQTRSAPPVRSPGPPESTRRHSPESLDGWHAPRARWPNPPPPLTSSSTSGARIVTNAQITITGAEIHARVEYSTASNSPISQCEDGEGLGKSWRDTVQVPVRIAKELLFMGHVRSMKVGQLNC